MKTIYFYDVNTKSFMYSDLIKDEVEIPLNATTIPPETDGRGMYDPTWDGEKWVELSESDWIDKHKNDNQEPTTPELSKQDQINAELLKTTAQLQLDNAALLKEIAIIKGGEG